ncbi:MAG: DUF4124 domain-containing protein [Gammaproteobacteria bacterium]|jgi:hypothetical protein|nr:DUF4124 domain-containing protein [Gammaproteobacteria bacterium]
MQSPGYGFAGQAVAHSRSARPVPAAPLLLAGLLVLLSAVAMPAEAAKKKASTNNTSSAKVYRWVDAKGVVHYSDQIPVDQAPADRQVLNQYGVPIRSEQGAMSQAELDAEKRAAAEREAARTAAERDAVLLSTYLSVDEIEALRNRRMELMQGQISLTENYLLSLNEKREKLQKEASAFKPYNQDPEAEPIDAALAQELSDTLDSISLYEKTLLDTRIRQQRLAGEFEAAIARFKELKGP